MSGSTPILVVADDLTGSNATGARFARAGLRSATVTAASAAGPVAGFDAVIVCTDSRHLAPEVASRRVREVTALFPDAELVVKRIDTTLRGNVSAETDAVLRAVRERHPGERVRGLMVPAYPTSGRVTVDGMQLLDGLPLERTELRHDPHNPMHTSSVAEILTAQVPLTHRHVTLGSVLSGRLHALLAEGEEDVVICDALEESHIQAIAVAAARVAREAGVRWVSIDPGPAGAFLARELGLGRATSEAAPLLAVIGSITELSVRQADYLARSELVHGVDVDVFALMEQDGERETVEAIAAALSGSRFPHQVVVRTHSGGDRRLPEDARERLPGVLAATVVEAIRRTSISGLYSSGGDITAALLDVAGVEAFEVIGEVIPLAVYGRAVSGLLDGLPVVTKGGLIGTDVTAEACMNQLRALAEGSRENGRPPGADR